MIYVTGRRLSPGGTRPSHITHMSWQEVGTNLTDIWTRAKMVEWIDGGGVAKVHNAYGADPLVHTVHPANSPAYVQTRPDDTTSDNLLSLPPC
jgi:Protein of unknown function (DUF3892)